MSETHPTSPEMTDLITGLFDQAAQNWTEDEHPAPEVTVQITNLGIPVFGMEPEEFTDAAFDLWERLRVSETTIHRFADDTETVPARMQATLDRISDDARADLDFLVARHIGQPAVPIPA